MAHFQRLTGHRTGLLTVTFAGEISTRDGQKKLGNFRRRVLKKYFGASITVREWTFRGRPHFHIVIDCLGDITTGYNWSYHEEVTAWSKDGRKGAKPRGRLNRTPTLKKLHEILNEKGPLYGLGRMELVPIKKADAIGFYLGGYLAKSIGHKPADAKGTRAVNYSQRCPRKVKGDWSWANEHAWLWRAKLRTWATSYGCASMHDVAALFGPRWAYHHRDAILATELHYWPTSKHAQADGLKVPDDSIDIYNSGFQGAVMSDGEGEGRAAPAGERQRCKGVPPEARELRGAAGEAPCSNVPFLTSDANTDTRNTRNTRPYTIGNKNMGRFVMPRQTH